MAKFSKGGSYTYKGVEYPNTAAGYAAYVRAIRKDKNKATPQKQIATIKVSEKKTYKGSDQTAMDVGKKWMARGVKWFGVRKEMETQIENLMIKRINQLFKK